MQRCFSFMTKPDDNSTAHAKLQALYLPFVLKNGTESRQRRLERETNFEVFDKVNEPSFQVVWPCNVVLSTFNDSKRSYAIHQPITDSLKAYRGSPGVGTSSYRESKIPTYLEVAAWTNKSRREVLSFDLANKRSLRQDKRHLKNTTKPSFHSV